MASYMSAYKDDHYLVFQLGGCPALMIQWAPYFLGLFCHGAIHHRLSALVYNGFSIIFKVGSAG
jgi:hypothetical protein